MLLLAQAVDANGPPVDPTLDYGPGGSLWDVVLGWGGWLYVPFLIWMVVWCIRHDPERWIWLVIMLLFQPLGAVIYFFARWMPGAHWQPPAFLRKFTRKSEINRLHIAATQIGNPHQYIELGDALRETGNLAEAGRAYAKALDKDPRNTQALWGAGWVHFREKQFDRAHEKLARLIEIDPSYKFGDVSLLYAKTLRCLERNGEARTHLESHIRRWRHPEALYLLACIYADEGEPGKSREQLQALIMDIEASPSAIARKQMFWKSRARRLLRRLPK